MSWGGDQFMMPNMMAMPPMVWPNMMPNAMHHHQPPNQVPPEYNVNGNPSGNQNGANFPVATPAPQPQENVEETDEANTQDKGDRRDRDRYRDRGRHGRSRERERNDRSDRNDRSRSDRRDRRTKWSNDNTTPNVNNAHPMGTGNMIMHGNMMQYGSMMNHQPMEMANMQNMAQIMSPMPMAGMMDQNVMMINQQIPLIGNQPIYLSGGVLLPPTPGLLAPPRISRPDGCRTIFVGGLPIQISESLVTEMFQRFGEIDSIKMQRQGVCHVRYVRPESIEQVFCLSGYRFKYHDQAEAEAIPIYIDYALDRDDQDEYERNKRRRERDPTPPRIEPFLSTTLSSLTEKIKNDTDFAEAAPTLVGWLERGECNKKNANTFYSLIQATNNHIRRLVNEKMQIDEEFHTMKGNFKDKFLHVLMQFEQVAKILSAAKHQRVSDHFTKQQRRNVEMWLKMTEEVANMKDEYNVMFDDDETEKVGKNMVPLEKYEQLKKTNEDLVYELEGYKNEAHLAKDEAERKFEKFKAHFIAEQALKNDQKHGFSAPLIPTPPHYKSQTQPILDTIKMSPKSEVPHSEAKLISLITAFLMIHPLGATLDYLVSYLKSMMPDVSQSRVSDILRKYAEVFHCKTTGVGANIEHKWYFITFESMKK